MSSITSKIELMRLILDTLSENLEYLSTKVNKITVADIGVLINYVEKIQMLI